MICPICGYKKQQTIELLTLGGFSCPRCSDGKSWAEKFMFNIPTQLKVNFKNEVSKKDVGFEWCKNYRYDFYIELKNYKLLIEMDGHFHKDSKFNTYNESRIIDLDKDNLALDNGFNIVRMDCCYPDVLQRFEYIKRNILNSNLSKILDLTSIDWDVANNHALNSNVKKSADLFNSGITSVKQIGELIGADRSTVRKYLKIATEIGWCNYIIVNEKPLSNIKPIALYKDNDMVGVFISASELSKKKSQQLYGVYMDTRNISSVFNNNTRTKRVKGYTPKHITDDEYIRLLPQFLTIQN